jgi:hypothetical protein
VTDLTTLKVKKKRRRGRRKRKLHYLRRRLTQTKDVSERRRLIEKMRRISPRAPVPDI